MYISHCNDVLLAEPLAGPHGDYLVNLAESVVLRQTSTWEVKNDALVRLGK